MDRGIPYPVFQFAFLCCVATFDYPTTAIGQTQKVSLVAPLASYQPPSAMPSPPLYGPDVVPRLARQSAPALSDLEQAILLTVLYADLFDYPLTRDELYRRLVHTASNRVAFSRAVAALTGPYLTATQGYLTWTGREDLAAVREHRRQAAKTLWAAAYRYAGWLARVPFVRMVAVSGSLALRNAEPESDIDLFCITAPNRLWLARAWIVPLSKLTSKLPRLFPRYLCPNYILTLNALDIEDGNLFTAHEVTQAVPLWGSDAYRCFVRANPWVHDFLPHARSEDRAQALLPPNRPWYTRALERALQGRLGDTLDRLVHRLFVTFYRRRAERAGWPWHRLAPAYQRNRYTVPEGGYARVIHRLFTERVRQRLGPQIPDAALDQLFAFTHEEPARSVYDWESRFAEDYGVAVSNGSKRGKKEAPSPSKP